MRYADIKEQYTEEYKGHVIVVRKLFIPYYSKPFYVAYYSIDKEFADKELDWLDENLPSVHGGYSFMPNCLPKVEDRYKDLIFIGWDYNHAFDMEKPYTMQGVIIDAKKAVDLYDSKYPILIKNNEGTSPF